MSVFSVPQIGFSLMGIVNVTPDSFSDGGRYLDPEKAIAHGLQLAAQGADILDIGGESTRPGADPVDVAEETRRVMPVIKALRGCGARLSIDTRNAATMEAALDAGVDIVNDISALTHDPRGLSVVGASACGICLMHSKGDPKEMQYDPRYGNILEEITVFVSGRIKACQELGISLDRLIIDPGIGFGKTTEHNLEIMSSFKEFQRLRVPVLLGASRKRFIASLDKMAGNDDRLGGSIATCIAAYSQGVRHFRVHDVAETRQALLVYKAITEIS